MRERRIKKKKDPHGVFLVVCEGETEKEYVELLKRYYRVPVVIKTKVSGTKVNQRLVSQYLYEMGIRDDDNYKVFFVYDADVSHIVEKLKTLDGTPILSNPCIELWFILHVRDYYKRQDSTGIVKDLMASHDIWNNYQKGRLNSEQSKFLIENSDVAIARARHKNDNPSSNVYLLIEELEKSKNR